MQQLPQWKQQATKSEAELKVFIEDIYRDALRKVMHIQLATLWYRWAKPEKGPAFWDFNHIEDGHCPNPIPTPKHPSHNQVWKGRWAKVFVQLNGSNNVVGHFLNF